MTKQLHTYAQWTIAAVCCVATLSALGALSPAHAGLKVVTTTPDLAALVAEVGGKEVSVKAMSTANENPHYVDPRPSLVVSLAQADLLLLNGLELEVGWLPPLLVNARNRSIQLGNRGYFDASKHVRLLEVRFDTDRAMGDIHPGGNPHFLFAPEGAAALAIALGEKLAELDPEHARDFRANAKRVADELRSFEQEQRDRFAKLAPEKRRVVTYHRSLIYLLEWLEIDRPINVEPIPGVSPSPSHVARVLATMRSKSIGTIIQERFYPSKTSRTLAQLAKAQVLLIDGGTNFQSGERFIDRLRKLTEEIYVALDR